MNLLFHYLGYVFKLTFVTTSDQILIQGGHQLLQGFMSLTSTCLSVFTDPARQRIDRVFARTMTSPSGITCHSRRVPGSA